MRNGLWLKRSCLTFFFVPLFVTIFGYGFFRAILNKGQLTSNEQFAFARLRSLGFTNSVGIAIMITNIESQLDPYPHQVLNMQIALSNNSWGDLTIKKPYILGFGNFGGCDDDVVHGIFREDGSRIQMSVLTVDCIPNIPFSDDFETLKRGEVFSYQYQITPANMFLDNDETPDHILPPGVYYISATYDNDWIGYASRTDSSELGFTDINAWVGEVSSDRFSFVVPPYELPTETATP